MPVSDDSGIPAALPGTQPLPRPGVALRRFWSSLGLRFGDDNRLLRLLRRRPVVRVAVGDGELRVLHGEPDLPPLQVHFVYHHALNLVTLLEVVFFCSSEQDAILGRTDVHNDTLWRSSLDDSVNLLFHHEVLQRDQPHRVHGVPVVLLGFRRQLLPPQDPASSAHRLAGGRRLRPRPRPRRGRGVRPRLGPGHGGRVGPQPRLGYDPHFCLVLCLGSGPPDQRWRWLLVQVVVVFGKRQFDELRFDVNAHHFHVEQLLANLHLSPLLA
mmetsp:Transcript_6080/g.17370  ORF Transcript_6080/g.17370 Transcript_6080/m.17370 type:complete len:269 (+) Transcript_6080:101-907(+)